MVLGLMSNTRILGRKAGAGLDEGAGDEEEDDDDDDEEELDDVTEIVADAVVEPELPVAVNIYVVVEAGATVTVPATARPLPTPWSI